MDNIIRVKCDDDGLVGSQPIGSHIMTQKLADCYVLVERSARLELDGYDFVVWHVVLEACASDTW